MHYKLKYNLKLFFFCLTMVLFNTTDTTLVILNADAPTKKVVIDGKSFEVELRGDSTCQDGESVPYIPLVKYDHLSFTTETDISSELDYTEYYEKGSDCKILKYYGFSFDIDAGEKIYLENKYFDATGKFLLSSYIVESQDQTLPSSLIEIMWSGSMKFSNFNVVYDNLVIQKEYTDFGDLKTTISGKVTVHYPQDNIVIDQHTINVSFVNSCFNDKFNCLDYEASELGARQIVEQNSPFTITFEHQDGLREYTGNAVFSFNSNNEVVGFSSALKNERNKVVANIMIPFSIEKDIENEDYWLSQEIKITDIVD